MGDSIIIIAMLVISGIIVGIMKVLLIFQEMQLI